MRITVGHLLIGLGLGGYAAVGLGPIPKVDTGTLAEMKRSVIQKVKGLENLFKSGKRPATAAIAAPVRPEEPVPVPQAVVALSTAVTSQASPAPEPAPTKVATPEAPPRTSRARRRRNRRFRKDAARRNRTAASVSSVKKSQPAAPEPAAKSAPVPAQAVAVEPEPPASGQDGKLIGTFVSLKLKTGREVRGILEQQTASAYKIQLPGLGTFDYPKNNVVAIAPVQ